MRTVAIAALLALATTLTGCNPYAKAKEADTIEAYEAYLSGDPGGNNALIAKTRLEELYLERAQDESTVEAWDAYFEKYGDNGFLHERAREQHETFLFHWAQEQGTMAAWDQFLEAYPRCTKEHRREAEAMKKVSTYLDHLELSSARKERVNLAEDPDGPLNGWQFEVDVRNTGERTITRLDISLVYLGFEGQHLDRDTWPVASEYFEVPVEAEYYEPLGPGDERVWRWTAGDTPEGWAEQVKVYPSRIAFADE